jgi:hypothetical protein
MNAKLKKLLKHPSAKKVLYGVGALGIAVLADKMAGTEALAKAGMLLLEYLPELLDVFSE